MRKDHHVESHTRIPHVTYQKVVKVKEQTKGISLNQALCLCLDEYFQMKEAQEAAKQPVLKG